MSNAVGNTTVKLTATQIRALWRVYYAMRFRRDGHRPPEPTPEQWAKIEDAQRCSPGPNTYLYLSESGFLTWTTGGFRLTDAGHSAIATPAAAPGSEDGGRDG